MGQSSEPEIERITNDLTEKSIRTRWLVDGMRLLTRDEIRASLADPDPESLFLDPLLSPDQVGSISVDLALDTILRFQY